MPGARNRRGFVLAAMLLLLLGLTLLFHGSLTLLRIQERAARAGGLRLRARLLAEGTVRRAEVGPPVLEFSASGQGVGVVGKWTGPGETSVTRLRRLGAEWYLLEAWARVEGPRWVAYERAGRAIWILDGPARLATATATLESPEPPTGGGGLEGGTVSSGPHDWPARTCALHRLALDSLFPDAQLPPWHPGPVDREERLARGERAAPGLGFLAGRELLRRADVQPPERVKPETSTGACDHEGAASWGTPSDPTGPCGDLYRLVGAETSLQVLGGEGQGVLVTAGDLVLTGHRFSGIVLVGGSLRLDDGARVEGLVRSFGPVTIDGEARIEASGCAVLRAIAGVEPLARPVRPPGTVWIRPL